MQTFCTQTARACVTRSGNHDSPRTGPFAGGVVELIQLLLLLLHLGLVHSIISLRRLNDTNRAAGDPEGTDLSDGRLLSSLFLQTILLTARTTAAATGPTGTLRH